MKTGKLWAPAMALLVGACGGGIYGGGDDNGDGGNTQTIDLTGTDVPMTFAVPSDAAKAAAVIAGLIVPSGPTTGTGKSTTTTPCGSGGSVTFTTDDSTAFPSDGRRVYDQCTNTVGSDQFIQDGVTNEHCNTASSDNATCVQDFRTFGEQGAPSTVEEKSSTHDLILRLLLSDIQNTDGSTQSDRTNGASELENLLSHKSMTILANQLTLSITHNGGGTLSAAAGGTVGLNDNARSTANCVSGRFSVSTPTTLSLDSNENFNGGHLQFTSSSGSTADAVFNADGSVSASVNGGPSTVFSKTVLLGFCSVN